MGALTEAWLPRVEGWMRNIIEDFYVPLGNIDFCGFETDAEMSLTQAMARECAPIMPYKPYSHPFGYLWLRGEILLPESARGQRIVMDLQFHAEATLYVNGASFGTHRTVYGASEVRMPHHFMVDNWLTTSAQAGERYEVAAEVYCMPQTHDGNYHALGAISPERWAALTDKSADIRLGQSTFGIWQEEAYQLYIDVSTLLSLLKTMPATSLRAQRIARALKQFTLNVDIEQPREKRLEDYRRARQILAPCFAAKNGDSVPEFYAIGNSHLDLAWLWRLSETERKTQRTFAAQLRHMEEYPEYRFFQSQPASYAMCKQRDPELFAKIQEAVREGRWVADGAMWVEPDVNIPSGESLIRQVLYGKQFLREEFGVESHLLWLPDTFGYNASLPQILSGCGVEYMMTAKILWNYNGHAPFTEQFFRWRGNDGSEVTVFIPQTYVCGTNAESVTGLWEQRVQIEDIDKYLLPFGYGDGGGGPCRDDLETLRRERDLEGMPRIHFASPMEFFEESGRPSHVYAKELYFAAHQGTYTSGAKVKRSNRKLEIALRNAEMLGALAMSMGKAEYDYDRWDAIWKVMLLHQFHDILPGSSIIEVYNDTEQAHARIRAEVVELTERYCMALQEKKGIAVYNTLGWKRRAVVPLPAEFVQGAVDADGNAVPVMTNGKNVWGFVTVPACGWIGLLPREQKATMVGATLCHEGDGFRMCNEKLSLHINVQGEITSAVLLETGREFAAGEMNQVRMFKDVPQWFDVWDIHESYSMSPVVLENAEAEILCAGGLRAELRVCRKLGEASTLEQTISLDADASTVRMDTRVDWHECHRLLKVAFPTNVFTDNMLNEIQYGYVERPVYRSDKTEKNKLEVCSHRYTALAEGDCGMAVLNDCKYGVSAEGSEISLTLLRAPMAPQIDLDRGVHLFSYGVTFWSGSFAKSHVTQEAYGFNVPMFAAEGAGKYSAMEIDVQDVLLDTVKPAQDRSGDVIVRMYESQNRATYAILRTAFPVQEAWLCDMLENPQERIEISKNSSIGLDFGCFQVRTLRLKLR